MARLKQRLENLETIATPEAPPLLVLGRTGKADSDVIGIHGGGPGLPGEVPRLPGESLDALQARAAALVTGAGPLVFG